MGWNKILGLNRIGVLPPLWEVVMSWDSWDVSPRRLGEKSPVYCFYHRKADIREGKLKSSCSSNQIQGSCFTSDLTTSLAYFGEVLVLRGRVEGGMGRGVRLSICHRVYLVVVMIILMVIASIHSSLVMKPWIEVGLEYGFGWDAPWINYFLGRKNV
jgi:hypothetical protein